MASSRSVAGSRSDQEVSALAQDVISLARATLVVDLRFLDTALSELKLTEAPAATIGTDGRHLIYGSRFLLDSYKEERTRPTRFYLHTLFHCIFAHPFVTPSINRVYWNLACDVASEAAINDLSLRAVASDLEAEQKREIDRLKGEHQAITAERIYRSLLDGAIEGPELAKLERIFSPDDHSLWYAQVESESAEGDGDAGREDEESDTPYLNRHGNDDAGEGPDSPSGKRSSQADRTGEADRGEASSETTRVRWKQIAERAQVDLETASREWGEGAGNLMQSLREVARERYDYAEFLRRFAVPGEVLRVNDDEFDYVFYTYGLRLYGNLPLIEPLEYAESKHIREFVIAIDTSGSVSGEPVQRFMQKTYNILKQTESFFTRVNIHIIQCDADIQEDVLVTTQQEFDDYLSDMKIKGHGGTDFRPVFSHVDDLIAKGVFTDLKGLVYFTDGYGTFPERMPTYDAAFIFVDDEYGVPEVPPWAIKLVLGTEEL